jgi:hypothetical protein
MPDNDSVIEPLRIKYSAHPGDNFDLGVIGESFSGLDAVFGELCDLTGVNGEVDVKLSRIEHGSIEVFNTIQLTLATVPFENVTDLLDFLCVASPDLYYEAREFFSAIDKADRTANAFFANRPFDAAILTYLVGKFIVKCLEQAGKIKRNSTDAASERHIPKRHVARIRSMVLNGKFKRAFKPVTGGSVRIMKIEASDSTQSSAVVINEVNVGNYLPDDAKILPELNNGDICLFTGILLALQSTKGESLKIRVHNVDPAYSLMTAHPGDGLSTEDFIDLYKQQVAFTAMVHRRTLYKRPELIILEMHPLQGQLELEDQ